jgi:hypothetical protein
MWEIIGKVLVAIIIVGAVGFGLLYWWAKGMSK